MKGEKEVSSQTSLGNAGTVLFLLESHDDCWHSKGSHCDKKSTLNRQNPIHAFFLFLSFLLKKYAKTFTSIYLMLNLLLDHKFLFLRFLPGYLFLLCYLLYWCRRTPPFSIPLGEAGRAGVG